ncbi:MAG: ribosome recycling factor [Holosporales bacterium]|jgi:ribosome recycling factor|nr:ribosome recycling factor [Holosporales bacterium]
MFAELADLKKKMEGPIEALSKEFSGLRTGRAHPSLLEPILVEAYGGRVPLNQAATVSVIDARCLTVQVWDKTLVKSVEKALCISDIGVNPITEGQILRIVLPALTEEGRKDLCKMAGKYTEQARVALRSIRRDGMEKVKKLEKSKEISEDESSQYETEIQKEVDKAMARVETLGEQKEKEIMTLG